MAEDAENREIRDTIQIVSKHDVFKCPVTASIVSEDEFNALNETQMEQTGKSIQNSRVRERLLNKISDANNGPNQVVLTSLPQRINDDKSDFGDM